MQSKKLFSTSEGINALDSATNFLKSHDGDAVHRSLAQVLRVIRHNAEEFDRACQINVGWIGENTLDRLNNIRIFRDDINTEIDEITADIFRFVTEYDLSIKNILSVELSGFLTVVGQNLSRFSGTAKSQIEFAQGNMAAAIVKSIINTDDFRTLRDLTATTTRVENKIKQWNASLEEGEKKAAQLSQSLETHTRTFNFVGLHNGFSELAAGIEGELKAAKLQLVAFGILVLIPSMIEIYLIGSNRIDLENISLSVLIASLVTTMAITLILLYFFRIVLRQADASRAQLIQVRLRMSLCRFIQSYAEYSGEIKSKNGVALEKFETLIFSGIVSSDEKLPSTFDGIEQLAALAKSVRGGS